MRGDFSSAWNKEKAWNFRGTLHQQGRVLLDRDWNAQTEIFNDWQETAARDTIGAGVAAVPADAAESFKVTKAEIKDTPDRIELTVNKGHVWADGLLVNLEKDVVREAVYFPDEALGIPDTTTAPVERDAVILETWLEELNAFQMPELLVEPALGGVDTTERISAAFRFRLFRMGENDTCDSIIDQLKDDISKRGKLTAVLQDDEKIDGDCPVVGGGGYTGFEHQLYRIEIAETDSGQAHFKWSQFNGGLVGRGIFDVANKKVEIRANKNAVIHSGLSNFYLEALEFDENQGFWRVIYGAKASLGSDNFLNLSADIFTESIPVPDEPYFFRLWNGIEKVEDFIADPPKALQDGISLKFEPEADGQYVPRDFWTFTVRAGEIPNDTPLVDNQPPQVIFYHRVPLAELEWKKREAEIEDCRQIFQPLTKLKTCCTYRVGDGVSSHGDFTSIQKAIDNLPKEGGEICILSGLFQENLVLSAPNNRNITLKGCGNRSRIKAGEDNKEPVIHVKSGINLQIESLSILAHDEGVGILLEGEEPLAARQAKHDILRNIKLENLRITAATRSAVEMHIGQFVSIRGCQIFMKDMDTEWAAVYLAGDDILFEENEIRVMQGVNAKISGVRIDDPQQYEPSENATGGLHLSGGCERVRVINNIIVGGNGNGINLGSVDEETETIIRVNHKPSHKKKGPCHPKPGFIAEEITEENTRRIAGAPLRDILIERNRIYAMGSNGIGVDAFFVIEESNLPGRHKGVRGEFITIENLVIIGNDIRFCLGHPIADIPGFMSNLVGFGGISLANVENLIVRDNIINDNGANYLEPVCGIFVLLGEGIEISRNRIINNGRPTEINPNNQKVKNGARGGIFIMFALTGSATAQPAPAFGTLSAQTHFSYSNGVPALIMHENIVTVPMGRSLTMIAAGQVSIVGNQLTSQSVVPGFDLANVLASNIFILNLSISSFLHTIARFSDVKNNQSTLQYSTTRKTVAAQNATAEPKARGLLLSGSTLFADNQCRSVNLPVERNSGSISLGSLGSIGGLCSILILSLADIRFHDNYCYFLLARHRFIAQALVFGVTVRLSDNFLEEIPRSVFFSGATYGILNTTTDNQSTHCLVVLGKLYVNRYNLSLVDAIDAGQFQTGDVYEIGTKASCLSGRWISDILESRG